MIVEGHLKARRRPLAGFSFSSTTAISINKINRFSLLKSKIEGLSRFHLRKSKKKSSVFFRFFLPALKQGVVMLIQEAIQQFLEHLRLRNFSNNTIILRQGCLSRFEDFCITRNKKTIQNIHVTDLEKFILFLYKIKKKNGNSLSISRIKNHIISVRLLFLFLAERNFLLHNPALEIVLPKEEKRLPRNIFTVKEAEKILAMPNTSTAMGLRDKAILELFYATGIRLQELQNLKLTDFNLEDELLHIKQGKGNKDRVIPMGQRATFWLTKYLGEGRKKLCRVNSPDFVFLCKHGVAMRAQSIQVRVKYYRNRAKIKKPGLCHAFRHSMATHMLENGANVRYIQEMLGHVSLTTTQKYTRVNIHSLREVYDQTRPKVN